MVMKAFNFARTSCPFASLDQYNVRVDKATDLISRAFAVRGNLTENRYLLVWCGPRSRNALLAGGGNRPTPLSRRERELIGSH